MRSYPDYEDTKEYDEVKSRGRGSANKSYPCWVKNKEQYQKYLKEGENKMKCECGKEMLSEKVVIGASYYLTIFYCEDCGIQWCRDERNYTFTKGEKQ